MNSVKIYFTENHTVNHFLILKNICFVGVTGLEPATTRTPCVYATNCATPR